MTNVVINCATLAVSEHSGSPIDVFCLDNTVYRVEADSFSKQGDVADTDFVASLKTGKMSFVPNYNFNVHPAYSTAGSPDNVSGGSLVLKTYVSHWGKEEEYSYNMLEGSGVEEMERYIPLSRNVEGNYWQFEVLASGAWSIRDISVNLNRVRVPRK